MVEDAFTLDDVLCAMDNASLLENYPAHRRGSCCLIAGITATKRSVHVVCTSAKPKLIHYHGLRAEAAKVAVDDAPEACTMKCTIDECLGVYEHREVVHTVRHGGDVVVVDHVPAEVCTVCGDVLLTPDTVRRIEQLLIARPSPARSVPLYEYA